MAQQAVLDALAPAPDVLFARQPILDRDGRLSGYELLPRGDRGELPHIAAARVAALALSDLGLAAATTGAPAFVNVTAEFLMAMDPLPFGPDCVVLEVRADRQPDAAVLDRLARLRAGGYVVALDGFAGQPAVDPLVGHVAFAKVDVHEVGRHRLAELAAQLRALELRAVAFHLDTDDDRAAAREAGFALFQGDAVARTHEVVGRDVPVAAIANVRLAAGVTSPDVGVDELERAIAPDPGLSLRLLRFVAGTAPAQRHRIASVRQAVELLGPRTVRQWAMLLLLAGVREDGARHVATALTRGQTCEAIAARLGAPDPEAYFFTGLLSVIDAMLDLPMEHALADLPVAEDVRAALLERAGGKGRALAMAEACERGEPDAAALSALDTDALAALHAEAAAWAETALRDAG